MSLVSNLLENSIGALISSPKKFQTKTENKRYMKPELTLLDSQLPKVVIESPKQQKENTKKSTMCRCKKIKCSTAKCSCKAAGVRCTDKCKCVGCTNANVF